MPTGEWQVSVIDISVQNVDGLIVFDNIGHAKPDWTGAVAIWSPGHYPDQRAFCKVAVQTMTSAMYSGR